MKMLNFAKSFAVASLFAVSIFALSGCGGPAKIALQDNEKSAQGVAIENYLPQDTLMMMSITTQDKDQREALQKLVSYFPKEDMANAWQSAIEELGPKLKEAGITYKDDIAPLFGTNFRLTFGLAGDLKSKEANKYVAFTVADEQKAKSLLDKILEKDAGEKLKKGEAFGAMTVTDAKNNTYISLYKDTILITNSLKNRNSALKRLKNNEESILSNKDFKKSYERLPRPHLAIAFINTRDLFKKLQGNSDVQNLFSDALEGEAFAVTAEKDGLRVNVNVAFNEKSKDFNLKDFPYVKPYMYKKIPGGKLIMYSESYGLKNIVDLQLKTLAQDKEAIANFDKFKSMLKENVKLDFDKDIMSWMDKGFALVVQQNKGIIPAISLYIDANSNPKSAQKVLDLIDAGMEQAVASMIASAPEGLDAKTIIKKDKVKLDGKEINRVSFDVTGLSDEELKAAGLPSGVFVEPFEIYYGLTKDNYFLFSTYSGLDKDYGNIPSVADSQAIKDVEQYIKGYGYQLSYISIDEAVKYADNFVNLMQLVQGPMDKKVQENFDKVKSYLAPLKYIVGGNKQAEKNIAEGTMFVKMEQPQVAKEK